MRRHACPSNTKFVESNLGRASALPLFCVRAKNNGISCEVSKTKPSSGHMMRLFHFSDNPSITEFVPRAVNTPVDRPAGQEWLNGALVWAIDESHDFLYLFPRECPRILVWPTSATTSQDLKRWFSGSTGNALAFIEKRWLKRLQTSVIYQYELPTASFEEVGEIGMWVSRSPVTPIGRKTITDLPAQISDRKIGLAALDDLTKLRGIWDTTLHASGIRLRNAKNWGPPGWPHSPPK